MIGDEHHAWIFVSHASDDLARVREVRNYLESKGASPLLFHLMALTDAEEFWPIIEREISARNFFLYCQSAVAEQKEWVRRERAAVDVANRKRPIRIGSIQVDAAQLDFPSLDLFLSKTRVFPSFSYGDYPEVRPFLIAMAKAGFHLPFGTELRAGELFQKVVDRELERTAKEGWIVVFLSASSLQSPYVMEEIAAGTKLGAKFIPVALESISPPPHLAEVQLFDAASAPDNAPKRLVELLLSR